MGGLLAEKLQPRVAIYIGLVFFAAGWFLTGVGAVAWMIVPCPEGWMPEGWTPTATQAKELNAKNYNIPGMVKTPVFWVMVVMFIFANAAGTMMVSATSPIAQNQIGQNAMTAAMCVSIMTLANMCGRIGFGFIYDKLKGWNSLMLVLVLNGLSMCMLTVAKTLPYFIACICLVGFSFGGLLVVFAPIVKNVFGSKYYNRNYGLIFIGYGIGAFVGPKISATFYDSTGSYVAGYIGSALLAAAAVVLVFAARKLAAKMQETN